METAVRWSPSSDLSEQRFLIVDVKDKSFQRCKVTQYSGKIFKYEPTSIYTKVPGFRAFDWALNDENLVAVGSWSGEVSVLHLDERSPNILLPPKRQRLCNAVAFSRTGLLAAGLEGIRNDFSLNVWDVHQRLPSTASPGSSPVKQFVEPYRKFASSESISSIKFFTGQRDVFVAGIKGKGIRVYDLRENTGHPSLLFKTDSVFNLAIDPLDEHYFACAGLPNERTIQVWDCRSGTRFSASTMGSSFDLGHQAEKPMLEYKEVFKPSQPSPKRSENTGTMVSTIWSLRYCKGKSGCLGALSSSGEFKVFETKHGFSVAAAEYKVADRTDNEIPAAGASSMLTKRIHHVEHAYNDERYGRSERERIVAFDFTNLASSKGTPNMIILRGNQRVEIVELDGSPSALALSSLGDLVVSRPYESIVNLQGPIDEDRFLPIAVRVMAAKYDGKVAEELGRLRIHDAPNTGEETNGTLKYLRRSSRELHEQLLEAQISVAHSNIKTPLSFLSICRRRCLEGYMFDCKKNIGILLDNPWLQRFWTWIDRAKVAAENDGMVTDTLDLSFFGVASIWNNDLDSQRASNKLNKPTYSKEVAAAVQVLCERLDLPEFRTTDTSAPNHRRLCLYTCGLGLHSKGLEAYVTDLVGKGHNTKAAALAMMHDQARLAFQALRTGNTAQTHRELSLALAGYKKGNTNEDENWQEELDALKEEYDDPYARAVLALVRRGDWHDVLAETSLPLRDRIGIALMYLDDEELTQFIDSELTNCTKEGDPEGLVLTGLTEQFVPLLANYIRKFSDLQTAVLAISITCPRYFTDGRVDLWRETYRSHLNTWGMIVPRAAFDVQCAKLSALPNGRSELRPASRQVTLRCNYCDQGLDHNSVNLPSAPLPTSFGSLPEKIFGNKNPGTVCPRCGRHQPRCVLCMHWLGMPDPHSRGDVATTLTEKQVINKSTIVCRKCWHMSHFDHMKKWFASHRVCPAPDCDCPCGDLEALTRSKLHKNGYALVG